MIDVLSTKNLLLLTIDCLGADKFWNLPSGGLDCLHRLETLGVTFRRAFATTSSTTPSIASILTGEYPFVHGIQSTRGWSLSPRVIPLAEYLKTIGYKTYAYASGPLREETRLNRGFDEFVYVEPLHRIGMFRWGVQLSRMRRNTALLWKFLETHVAIGGPWFQWIHLLDLHDRWRKHRRRVTYASEYEHALEDLDKKLSKLFGYIDFDHTIVVVCGDHGHFVRALDHRRMPNIPYREAHGFHVYDVLTRVPLLMINRGVLPEGANVDHCVQTIDVLPTLLGMLHVPPDHPLPGIDLVSALPQSSRDATAAHGRQLYLQACGSILKSPENYLHGIRNEFWKYCEPMGSSPGRGPELYRLADDPEEQHNVYEDYREVAAEMREAMAKCLGRNGSGVCHEA